jgi:hypothetical protein
VGSIIRSLPQVGIPAPAKMLNGEGRSVMGQSKAYRSHQQRQPTPATVPAGFGSISVHLRPSAVSC